MSTVIDRRINPRDKTIRNRQKFIQRSKQQIRRQVKESISTGNIADIDKTYPRVKVKGISEPHFDFDRSTGNKQYVLPGNKDFVVGDGIKKPEESGSTSSASDNGEGEDEFEFVLDKEEYLDFLFEELELPDLVKKQMREIIQTKFSRAGYTNNGSPSRLDIKRTAVQSFGRRLGLKRPKNVDIEQLEQELLIAEQQGLVDQVKFLYEEIERLKRKQKFVPWIDPVDVRYRNYEAKPFPSTKAVMICIMDVSGSMGEYEKDLSKRFFFLLHLFLQRKYSTVELVFIRHHTSAKEVDEQEFFYSKESGGTVVSSAIKLTREIIMDRYSPDEWNIYVAQSSDGDNYSSDGTVVVSEMRNLLPHVQYYAYVEILNNYHTHVSTELWSAYESIEPEYSHMKMRVLEDIPDVWKVFSDLFSRERQKL